MASVSRSTLVPSTLTSIRSGPALGLLPSQVSSTSRSKLRVCNCPAVRPLRLSVWLALSLKRPLKRLKVPRASALTVPSLNAALAVPDSKLSENTVVAPRRTSTLSMPQLSSARPCSPPSAKRTLAVLALGVKLTVTLRYTASALPPKPRLAEP